MNKLFQQRNRGSGGNTNRVDNATAFDDCFCANNSKVHVANHVPNSRVLSKGKITAMNNTISARIQDISFKGSTSDTKGGRKEGTTYANEVDGNAVCLELLCHGNTTNPSNTTTNQTRRFCRAFKDKKGYPRSDGRDSVT